MDSNAPSNLTRTQQRLWLGHKMDPQLYNTGGYVRVQTAVDADRLRCAISFVNDASDLHNSAFIERGGVPQRVARPQPLHFHELDFSSHSNPSARFETWLANERDVQLDIETRLQRHYLIKLSESEYVWDWVEHHLINDFYSFANHYQAVCDVYSQLARNGDNPAALPQLEIGSFDLAVSADREYVVSDACDAAAAYWAKELATPLPALNIYGVDRSRGTAECVRRTIELPVETAKAIRAMAEAPPFKSFTLHQSLFMLSAALTAAWVSRASGNTSVGIGSFFHNRRTDVDRSLYGPLISWAPMRIEIEEEDSLASIFKKLNRKYRYAVKHAKFSPGNPADDRSFDVGVNYVPSSFVDFDGVPTTLTVVHPGHWYPSEPLSIQVWDLFDTGGLSLTFDFNAGIFDAAAQQRCIDHMLTLLNAAQTTPKLPIAQIELLSRAETELVKSWGYRAVSHPNDTPIIDLLDDLAVSRGNALAVENLDTQASLTFAELISRANALANILIERGVEKGQLIGLCFEPSIDYAVAQLAVLKAGAAFLPLDPGYPLERLLVIIKDADVELLLTASEAETDLTEDESLNLALLCVDGLSDELTDASTDRPQGVSVAADDLAYVIYTSGSTGAPKGVMLEHRGLTNMAFSEASSYRLDGKTRLLQFASVNFDAAVCDFFATWISGGCVCVASLASKAPGAPLHRLLADNSVTAVVLTPTVLSMTQADELPDLLTIGSAGEACTPDVFRRWSSQRHFVNSYGPTECTVCATAATADDLATGITIGRPLDNVEVLILDSAGHRQLPGVAGEICLAGVQLARGYWRRPELTDTRFPGHPEKSGQRIYKTGDLARFRNDGAIEYLGRLDNQVKVRGVRVELGEVESILAAQDGVTSATVMLDESHTSGARLVAYIVADPELDLANLKAKARALLPAACVPSVWLQLDELPRTANGKLDHAALPTAPDTTSTAAYIEPQDELETTLAAIVAGILDVSRIGREDNFFDLGAHSLMITALMAQIGEHFDAEISMRSVFEEPTLIGLANAIRLSLQGNADSAGNYEEFEL